MNPKSCAKLAVVMLVAMVASQASVTRASNFLCQVKCWTLCAPNPSVCLPPCLRKCGDKVETTQDQCNLGCLISKCLDPHPADAKKAEACANLCAKGCEQAYRKF